MVDCGKGGNYCLMENKDFLDAGVFFSPPQANKQQADMVSPSDPDTLVLYPD